MIGMKTKMFTECTNIITNKPNVITNKPNGYSFFPHDAPMGFRVEKQAQPAAASTPFASIKSDKKPPALAQEKKPVERQKVAETTETSVWY